MEISACLVKVMEHTTAYNLIFRPMEDGKIKDGSNHEADTNVASRWYGTPRSDRTNVNLVMNHSRCASFEPRVCICTYVEVNVRAAFLLFRAVCAGSHVVKRPCKAGLQ